MKKIFAFGPAYFCGTLLYAQKQICAQMAFFNIYNGKYLSSRLLILPILTTVQYENRIHKITICIPFFIIGLIVHEESNCN